MAQLNEDVLRYIVSYLSPETLKEVNAANRVFFNEWMKSRYKSLTFTRNDELLDHLRYISLAVDLSSVAYHR